jgi:hypothetical protein
VDKVRLDRMMEAGMMMEVPVGKADRHCCPGEIHCCKYPVVLMRRLPNLMELEDQAPKLVSSLWLRVA